MSLISKIKMLSKSKFILFVKTIILSYLAVFGLQKYLNENILSAVSILNIILFFVFLFLTDKALKSDKRSRKYGYVFGLILSVVLVVGKSFYLYNSFSGIFSKLDDFLISMLTIIGLTAITGSLLTFIFCFLDKHKISSNNNIRGEFLRPFFKKFLVIWPLIFICYIPCYLAYFPGVLSYDTYAQVYMAKGAASYTQFHPVLHTFFIDISLGFEELTKIANSGIIFYSIAQMLILSAIFAFIIYYMAKQEFNVYIIIFSFLMFALFPLNAIFSFIPTKDVLFAVAFLILTINIINICKDSNKFFASLGNNVSLLLSCVFCCLLRNNALYVIILLGIIFIFAFKKQWEKVSLCFFITLLLYFVIIGPFFTMLEIQGGNPREALCVPLQQMASVKVKHKYELTYEQVNEIKRYLGDIDYDNLYNPRFADTIKDNLQVETFTQDPKGLLKIWWELFLEYPNDYIDAFTSLNYAYWYPDAPIPDEYSRRIYIETYINNIDLYTFERKSLSPKLYEFYESIASYEGVADIPVISTIFSIGTPIWLMFFAAAVLMFKRKKKLILALVPSILLWLTYLAGPVANCRYMYPLFALMPLVIALILQPEVILQDKKDQEEEKNDDEYKDDDYEYDEELILIEELFEKEMNEEF